MLRTLTLIAATALMGACSYVDRYEAGVYHYEPTYCYQSIGAVRCYRTSNHRDEKRLVNYYGPHPTRFEKPPAAEKSVHNAPLPVSFICARPGAGARARARARTAAFANNCRGQWSGTRRGARIRNQLYDGASDADEA